MEIKEGEYIRTKDGNIRKVSRVDQQQHYTYVYAENGFYHTPLNEIENHSFNIIDLIQEGDYVNGYKVINLDTGYVYVDNTKLGTNRLKTFTDYQIQSIVTKEQFSSLEYII